MNRPLTATPEGALRIFFRIDDNEYTAYSESTFLCRLPFEYAEDVASFYKRMRSENRKPIVLALIDLDIATRLLDSLTNEIRFGRLGIELWDQLPAAPRDPDQDDRDLLALIEAGIDPVEGEIDRQQLAGGEWSEWTPPGFGQYR